MMRIGNRTHKLTLLFCFVFVFARNINLLCASLKSVVPLKRMNLRNKHKFLAISLVRLN